MRGGPGGRVARETSARGKRFQARSVRIRGCAAKHTALAGASLTFEQVQEHWPEGRVVPETDPSPKAREAEMLHAPALLIGMAGTAFVAASYAPLTFGPSTPGTQV